jgi:hypothetical protein
MCGVGSFLCAMRGQRPRRFYTRRFRRPTPPARTHPPCIGAGEIGARDQRVGGKRAPLIGPQRLALHSVVPPSGLVSRARGTAISIGPNVPVSDRVRLPWRWPATPALPSLPAIRLRSKRGRASTTSSSPRSSSIEPELRSRPGQTNCRKINSHIG